MKRLIRLINKADRWLCVNLRPLALQTWWRTLWFRQDEFHPCYDQSVRTMLGMSKERRERYVIEVMLRRQRAHEQESA